jgi:hypothetical protein
MSEPRRDGPFEIPVERLAGGRGQRRRAIVAGLSIAAVVGGAVGLALIAGDGPGTSTASRGPAIARASASAASGTPVASSRPNRVRSEDLLDIPDRSVAGAPHLTLVQQDGQDLTIRDWTPGAGLATVRTVPGAVAQNDPAVFPILDPAGERILLLAAGDTGQAGSGATGDRARLLDRDGRVLWTADDIAAPSGAVWSTDGRMVVTAGVTRRWHVVSIGRGGAATDRVIRLPGEVFLPSPTPIGSMSIPRTDPRTVPLGFSSDGRWAYGGIVSPELGMLIGEFRLAVDGSKVERILDLGVGRRDGLAPQPGTLGGRLVDPLSGRIANTRANIDTAGGAPTLEVRNADAGLAFVVDTVAPLGSWWGPDGGLDVLTADSILYPSRTELVRVDADGAAGPPILATGPITSAGFIGVRNGFAAVVISVTRPSTAAQVVLVDLADPTRTTALGLPVEGLASIIAAELRP